MIEVYGPTLLRIAGKDNDKEDELLQLTITEDKRDNLMWETRTKALFYSNKIPEEVNIIFHKKILIPVVLKGLED